MGKGKYLQQMMLENLIFVLFSFLAMLCSMWILLPQPGIEPTPPALEVQSLNHWTTREVPSAEEFEYPHAKE